MVNVIGPCNNVAKARNVIYVGNSVSRMPHENKLGGRRVFQKHLEHGMPKKIKIRRARNSQGTGVVGKPSDSTYTSDTRF